MAQNEAPYNGAKAVIMFPVDVARRLLGLPPDVEITCACDVRLHDEGIDTIAVWVKGDGAPDLAGGHCRVVYDDSAPPPPFLRFETVRGEQGETDGAE